jgi:ribose transport system permease protein
LTGSRTSIAALRDYGVVVATVAVFVALAILSEPFLTKTNLLNILDQNAAIGIIAVGGTLVLIAGGFDLSVGAIFALTGVVAAQLALHSSPVVAMVAAVLVGCLCGAANGLITTVGRINAFMGTLASSIIIRGLAVIAAGGSLIAVSKPSFSSLGSDAFLGLKYTVWLWAVFAIICTLLLMKSTFGRAVYACGDNPEAARLAGVRVGLVRGATFVISGLAAGLAGIIETSRVATGQADVGVGLELSAIAAIVIGGTSLFGGEGAVWRTITGVLLLALISNGFNLLGVDPTYQQIFQGSVILVAVAVDAWSRKSAR